MRLQLAEYPLRSPLVWQAWGIGFAQEIVLQPQPVGVEERAAPTNSGFLSEPDTPNWQVYGGAYVRASHGQS